MRLLLEFTDILRNYTGMMVLSCLFMAAAIVVVSTNRIIGHAARRAFVITAAAIIAVSITDWISVVVDGQMPNLRILHTITSAITFTLAPAIPVALVDAIFPKGRIRAIWVLVVAHAVLEIASLFGGFVFWVDEAGVYHRGPLYLAYILTYFISGVYLIVQSIRAGRAYQTSNIIAIIAIVICLASGVIIQLVVPSVHTSWAAVAMALMLYFAYYCDLILRTDVLTMLLNRRSYEEFLQNPPRECTVVSLDIDDFKMENDTYGHSHGDTCLASVAGAIRQVYGPYGNCYRTGGDEFVVVITKLPDSIDHLETNLTNKLDEIRARDKRVPAVSVGWARFEGDDIMATVDLADQRMYASKRTRKLAAMHAEQ